MLLDDTDPLPRALLVPRCPGLVFTGLAIARQGRTPKQGRPARPSQRAVIPPSVHQVGLAHCFRVPPARLFGNQKDQTRWTGHTPCPSPEDPPPELLGLPASPQPSSPALDPEGPSGRGDMGGGGASPGDHRVPCLWEESKGAPALSPHGPRHCGPDIRTQGGGNCWAVWA